jgi:hypothetical protein
MQGCTLLLLLLLLLLDTAAPDGIGCKATPSYSHAERVSTAPVAAPAQKLFQASWSP